MKATGGDIFSNAANADSVISLSSNEEIDWQGGEDPQFSTWIPVSTEEDIKAATEAPAAALSAFVPRLCKDWPRDEKKARIHWVRSAR